MSTVDGRIAIYGAIALIGIGGIWYLKWKDSNGTVPMPSTAQTPPTIISYDPAGDCRTLDLKPGKKFVSLIANSHYYHIITRNMHAEEPAEPEIEIISLTNIKPECAYIIREHALPATSASK